MNEPVAWMDGRGNVFTNPDKAERGQTMRPLYLEQPTHPNLEEILNRAGFYRRREWEGLTDDFCYIEGSREAERISIPPKREWVGLTDDEFDSIDPKLSLFQFHKAIEAKLKEKNND